MNARHLAIQFDLTDAGIERIARSLVAAGMLAQRGSTQTALLNRRRRPRRAAVPGRRKVAR